MLLIKKLVSWYVLMLTINMFLRNQILGLGGLLMAAQLLWNWLSELLGSGSRLMNEYPFSVALLLVQWRFLRFSSLIGSGALRFLKIAVVAFVLYVPGTIFASNSMIYPLLSKFIREKSTE